MTGGCWMSGIGIAAKAAAFRPMRIVVTLTWLWPEYPKSVISPSST